MSLETVSVLLLDIKGIADHRESVVRLLSDEEIKASDRYLKDSDKLLHLGSAYLKKKYVEGNITIDSFGKPKSDRCFFNISHSRDLVGIAITQYGKVGLDIENKEELKDDVKAFCLSDYEINELGKETATEYFVSKESLAKAEGSGLPNDIKSLPALPLNGEVEYKGKKYFRHTVDNKSHYISVTLEGADFITYTEELEGNE